MNKTIKELINILEAHQCNLPKVADNTIIIYPKDVANYLYAYGYRKQYGSGYRKQKKEYCKWKYNPDYEHSGCGHDTDCGHQPRLEYSLQERGYKYCMFCGKKIKVVQ